MQSLQVLLRRYSDGIDLRQFLRAVLLLALALALSATTTDPDLWGHVRFGQDILASHTIPSADPYSFTSDREWINHEWLAEVLFAVAFNAFGPLGLNLLRVGIIAVVLGLVGRRLLVTGGEGYAIAGVALATVGIFLRVYPVRPQLFSLLLFAVLLDALTRYDADRSIRRLMVVVPTVLALWANLHGGWLVGLGVVVVWSAARIAFPSSSSAGLSGRRLPLALLPVIACAATLINPYGPGLWRFLQLTVSMHRPMVSDWLPLHALPVAFWGGWIASCVMAIVVVRRVGRKIDPAYLAIVVLLGCASLRVSRIDAFFALAVPFLFIPVLAAASGAVAPLLAGAAAAVEAAPTPRRSRALAFATAALTVAAAIGIAQRLPDIDARYPMVPEPEVEAYIRTNKLTGRMLTWFDWGEYAIWHLSPSIQVSMDGRRETVYSDARVADHLNFYFDGPQATGYPDTLGADYIWIPKTLRVVPALRAAGWRAVFEGPYSVILVRSDHRDLPTLVVSREPTALRYFPAR